MKKIFMAVNKNVYEVEVIKEDNEYYFLNSDVIDKVEKNLNVKYTLSNDDEIILDETKEGLIKKYNEDIMDRINIFENKIKKLQKKLMK